MDAHRQHQKYTLIFAGVAGAVLAPVLALNFMLGLRSLDGSAAVLRASEWQHKTHGVTYSPPLSANRPFKSARLFDRLPEINTVVFGSSTAWGITQDVFPSNMPIYNFAQSGNMLITVIAEAEYLQRAQSGIKWLVIPLDLLLGFPYQPGTPGREELRAPGVDDVSRNTVSVARQLEDAMSLPRVKNLLSLIKYIARAPSWPTAFAEVFLKDSSDEYHCADGTLAKDFDTINRGSCAGFRHDGSSTFANLDPVPPRRAEALIASAVVPSSKYALALTNSGGEPNPVILDRLAILAQQMRARGGGIILFMPPLLPGLERALLNAPHTGAPLRHTKEAFGRWARANNLSIIDAGESERYGCTTLEFFDEHHPLPACYARVFGDYWRDKNAQKAPGLWHGGRSPEN
jgi:hypothetical protein